MFSNNSQAKFFFTNHAYLNAYIQLFNGIRRHGGLFLLTGQAGIGKTCLLHKLEKEIPENIKLVFCYSTNLDYENLITVICDKLGLNSIDKQLANKVIALKEFIIKSANQGIKVAFLIDDAHSLEQNVLRDFLGVLDVNLADGNTPSIVLSGIPILEENLEQAGVAYQLSAKSVRIRLESLTTSDVATYLSRLIEHIDSLNADCKFSPLAIRKITRYTGGIPRLINALCERAFFLARLGQENVISIDIIDEAASDLMLHEKENIPDPIAIDALDDIDLQNETQFNDESWRNRILEPEFAVECHDDKTNDILNDTFLNEESDVDLDQTVNESVFNKLSGCPVTAVSFTRSNTNGANQLARLSESAAQLEYKNTEVVRSDLDPSTSGEEHPINAIIAKQWDYLTIQKYPRKLFRPQNFQFIAFVFIAILAGLLGGVGGVYLFHHDAEHPVPVAPLNGGGESSHDQAIASMQPISTPKLSDEHRRPESNQAGVLVSSASSSMLSSSSGTEFLKPDNTASAFQAKHTMPLAVTFPLPLLEPELPADFVLALQSGSIISGLISPPLAREKKPSVGLVASRITDTHKSDLESTPVSEPANDTTANVTNNKKPMVVDSFPEKTIVEATITSSLMTSGDAYMERGDIASARLFYLEAVKNGFPAAMFAVGNTYDPIVLKKLGIKGFPAEPDKAVEWYLKAEKAGYVEASEYLLMLKQ